MPWIRVDDHFDEHPKFAKAGPLGIALWLAGLAYCNRNLTDGFIPWAKAQTLLSWDFLGPETNEQGMHRVNTIAVTCGMAGDDVDSNYVVELLCAAGLWEQVDGGYRVHDYDDYQPTKEQVEAERAKKVAAGQAGGRASAQARATSNGRAHAAAPAQAKTNPVPKPNPVPGPVPKAEEPETFASLRSAARSRAAPPGNPRVAAVIDAFRAFTSDKEPSMNDRDRAAIKRSTAPPELIAETYLAVEDGEWGDDFQKQRLSVHEACDWVNAYARWRDANGIEPMVRRVEAS